MNIIETLSAQRKGRAIIEAQTKLQDLVKRIVETGKKGSLTIKLEIMPPSDGALAIKDTITPKMPEAEKSVSLFYADDDGSLHREDPKQPSLPGVIPMDPQTKAANSQ